MMQPEEDTSFDPQSFPTELQDRATKMDDPLSGRRRLLDLDPHTIRAHPLLEQLGLVTHVLATKPYLPLGPELRAPIVVTTDGFILEGLAERDEAINRRQRTVQCLQCDYNDEETINYLVAKRACPQELNDFCRVFLALEWSGELRKQARRNQEIGGRRKGSTKLPNALRVDVRKSVAARTGVSEGNVTKVRAILREGAPKLIKAAMAGDIRIDRAFRFLNPPESQEQLLDDHLSRKSEFSIHTCIRQLVRRHRLSKPAVQVINFDHMYHALSAMEPAQRSAIQVRSIEDPGPVVGISDSLRKLIVDASEVEHDEG